MLLIFLPKPRVFPSRPYEKDYDDGGFSPNFMLPLFILCLLCLYVFLSKNTCSPPIPGWVPFTSLFHPGLQGFFFNLNNYCYFFLKKRGFQKNLKNWSLGFFLFESNFSGIFLEDFLGKKMSFLANSNDLKTKLLNLQASKCVKFSPHQSWIECDLSYQWHQQGCPVNKSNLLCLSIIRIGAWTTMMHRVLISQSTKFDIALNFGYLDHEPVVDWSIK